MNNVSTYTSLYSFGDGLLCTFEDADGYEGSGYPNAVVLYEFGKYYAEHKKMHAKDPNHNCDGCTNHELDAKALQALKIAAIRAYMTAHYDDESDEESVEPVEQPVGELIEGESTQ